MYFRFMSKLIIFTFCKKKKKREREEGEQIIINKTSKKERIN